MFIVSPKVLNKDEETKVPNETSAFDNSRTEITGLLNTNNTGNTNIAVDRSWDMGKDKEITLGSNRES